MKWGFLVLGCANLIASIAIVTLYFINSTSELPEISTSAILFVICFGVFFILDKLDELAEKRKDNE